LTTLTPNLTGLEKGPTSSTGDPEKGEELPRGFKNVSVLVLAQKQQQRSP